MSLLKKMVSSPNAIPIVTTLALGVGALNFFNRGNRAIAQLEKAAEALPAEMARVADKACVVIHATLEGKS